MAAIRDNRSAADAVFSYHSLTKHHPWKYAPSPGHLDWANEPDPFRRYEGAETVPLPLAARGGEENGSSLYERRRVGAGELSLDSVAAFLELSVGLSAWKSYGGSTWALRMNPSSGNLHPTEVYLILPPTAGTGEAGVFHYNPLLHSLERRMTVGPDTVDSLEDFFSAEGFMVGLSSIHWREAWKYGERAFRYCNHDVGHALAALSFSANLQGWKVTLLDSLSDLDIEAMLGFDRTTWHESEREYGDLLCFVHDGAVRLTRRTIPRDTVCRFGAAAVAGTPNRLSPAHVRWKQIEQAVAATEKPETPERPVRLHATPFLCVETPGIGAAEVIRKRRSGQAYDGGTSVPLEDFFCMLDRTVPRIHAAPFDLGLAEPLTHLLLYVHRINGLAPGLYLLLREGDSGNDLRASCSAELRWERVGQAPQGLDLYLLREGDFREASAVISCNQDIAGDGAFALSMIARFRDVIEQEPYAYRRLFWEAGMIGQVLYMEAESRGFRGTGIGCYFDDLVHQLLGFKDDRYQCTYNFTVGRAVEDSRLLTLPAYHHLEGR